MSSDNVNSSCCMAVTTSFFALPFLCQLLTKEHVNAALTLHSPLLVWLLPVSLPRATLASALSPYMPRSGSEVLAFPPGSSKLPFSMEVGLHFSSGLRKVPRQERGGKGECHKG